MKCWQGVAIPCCLLFDFNSIFTICTYTLSELATGNHQPVFCPATEHGHDTNYDNATILDINRMVAINSAFDS